MMAGEVCCAQAPADGKPVFAGKHEIEHQQVIALASELLVHAARVRHGLHFVAFAGEIAHEQVAQALVIVHYEDARLELSHGQRIVTKIGRSDTPWRMPPGNMPGT